MGDGNGGDGNGPTGPVSRRRALQTLGAATGMLLPSITDLNAARTLAAPFPDRTARMTFADLAERANALAAAPYRPRPDDLPPALGALTYDAYRAITFRPEASPADARRGHGHAPA